MIRFTIKSIISNIKSKYFLLGLMVTVGIFFLGTGKGTLSIQIQQRPLIIQEILRYPPKRYLDNILDFNSATMFQYGLSKFFYLVMPLSGIGFLLQFCDERYGGFDRMILARIGKRSYLGGTLLTSAVISALTVFISCLSIMAVLYYALPSVSHAVEVYGVEVVQSILKPDIIYANGLLFCLKQSLYASVLAIIGGWMGFFFAVLTESKFLSVVLPVLVFEVWTEICNGSVNYLWARLSIPRFFNAIQNGIPLSQYLFIISIMALLCGGGFYTVAILKYERGR